MEDKEKKLALQKAVGERVYHSRKLARMSKEELASVSAFVIIRISASWGR